MTGATPPFSRLDRPWTPLLFHIAGVVGPPSPGGRSRHNDPCRKARIPDTGPRMKWGHVFPFVLGLAASTTRYLWSSFPSEVGELRRRAHGHVRSGRNGGYAGQVLS